MFKQWISLFILNCISVLLFANNQPESKFEIGQSITNQIQVDFDIVDSIRLNESANRTAEAIISFLIKNYEIELAFKLIIYAEYDSENYVLAVKWKEHLENQLDMLGYGISYPRMKVQIFNRLSYMVSIADTARFKKYPIGTEFKPVVLNELSVTESKHICSELSELEILIYHISRKSEIDLLNDSLLISGFTGVLNDVRFNIGSKGLRYWSYLQIDEIARFMTDNPTTIIEVQHHRDCRGSSFSSSRLTQKRAEAIVERLAYLGIDKVRMIPKGMEESQPFVHEGNVLTCEFIAGQKEPELINFYHQLNRRVEIRVLAMDYVKQ